MSELKTRVDELKMENEYQLRLKDMSYNEKIKELTEKFIQEMESLKTKNQVLKTEKDKEEAKHDEEMGELMEKNAKELQDLGTLFFNFLYGYFTVFSCVNADPVEDHVCTVFSPSLRQAHTNPSCGRYVY